MAEQKKVIAKEVGGSGDRFWNPRIWDGMTFSAWNSAFWKGKLHVAPSRIVMAGIIYVLGVLNSSLALAQWLFYGRKIKNTELVAPPIFVIGHWRSGTTLLHEYIICDDQFAFSDTYQCFAPAHFLFSGPFFRPWLKWLMPKKRPMDNMLAGLDRPQEDEFALCSLGLPSTYLDILFPNSSPIDANALSMRSVAPEERKKWLDSFEWFLKAVTAATPKRIVLKSPPHTARVRTILERFPDAKFIHIHRNPYTLFPSTYTLWTRMSAIHGLQHPTGRPFEEKIFSEFETMYEAFDSDRSLLKPEQLIEVSYDQLVENPVGTLETIYSHLGLNDFESVRPKFDEYAQSHSNYKKNKFDIAPELEVEIKRRWSSYLERYGYTIR